MFGDKHNLPRSQRVLWANWSGEGRQEAMENPSESQLKHASVEMTKGFAFKPQFLVLMPVWGRYPQAHESLPIFNLSKPSTGVV